MRTLTQPKRVEPLRNSDDMEVLLMGALGQSTKSIAAATGYTSCQITYRLHKEGIKRMDYRNGESDIARNVLASARNMAVSELKKKIVAKMKEMERKL